MDNKITLAYDGKTYQVAMNEQVIATVEKIEDAYKSFEKTIANNKLVVEGKWETIREQVEQFGLNDIEVFDSYQAIQYQTLKYFHQTGMLFYMEKEEMVALTGGYRFLLFLLERIAHNELDDSKDLIELCSEAIKEGIGYRIKEASLTLSSPVFNYGNVTYNFSNQEMHKGTQIEKVGFDVFKAYVLEVIHFDITKISHDLQSENIC